MSSSADSGAPASKPTGNFGFEFRFALLYGGLATILLGAIVGVFVLARQPSPPKPPPWSTWRPPAASTATMTNEIATHIASEYRLSKGGRQLVAIVPSAPETTRGTTINAVSTIGFLPTATSKTLTRVIAATGNVQDQFCGLGSVCAVTAGAPSDTRNQLLRREALELALYTFKYVPAVNAVIAYLPPVSASKRPPILYLERANLQPELDQPLARTLPLATPPLPNSPDLKEKAAINKLTNPVEYNAQFQSLPDGTQAMILAPTSS